MRKLALRLPEAEGLRCGVQGKGSPLRLLICGDSAAAGVGITSQQQALSGQLVAQLSSRHQLQWQLQAKTGLTSLDLVKLLQNLPSQGFDVVVISIGVNDVTALRAAVQYRHTIRQIMMCLQQKFAKPVVLFTAIPAMEQFIALPVPLNHWLGLKATALNQVLKQELVNWPQALIVNAKLPLTKDMFACDGFHPSASGCAIWAQMLIEAYQQHTSQ